MCKPVQDLTVDAVNSMMKTFVAFPGHVKKIYGMILDNMLLGAVSESHTNTVLEKFKSLDRDVSRPQKKNRSLCHARAAFKYVK